MDEAFTRAYELHTSGQLAQAETMYRQILASTPDHHAALHGLGLIAYQCGNPGVAVELIGRAAALAPNVVDYLNNLGNALRDLGRLKESIAVFQKALDLQPMRGEIWTNFGSTLRAAGMIPDAVIAFRRAVAVQPTLAEAYNNLGIVLEQLGAFDEATGCFRRAIELRPSYAEPLINLGNLLETAHQNEQAMLCYQRAIAVNPNLFQAHNNLGNVQKAMGQMEDALVSYRCASELNPKHPEAAANMIYAMHFDPNATPLAIRDAQMQFDERYCKVLLPAQKPAKKDAAGRKLKIGYVSGDFRQHVVATNLLPILENHHRDEFEIFAYSNAPHPDALTEKIKSHCDQWREIRAMSDMRAAEMIRADEIDMLVDLSMHSAGNRLLLFARKPAPVAITWLAYCGAAGIGAIDFRFSDKRIDDCETEADYVEKTLYLPNCFWCYHPAGAAPEPNSRDGEPIVFGCMNNFAKVSQPVRDLWRQILDAVPNSRLLVQSQPGPHLTNLREQFGDRIEFIPRQGWDPYIQTYQRIDIALDTTPFNGGITTCDALYMGLPVVTLAGMTSVGRAGKSILNHLDLARLVADSPEKYVEISIALAGDIDGRRVLRQSLRQKMSASPLMDALTFTTDLEALYRRAWDATEGK